MFIAGLKLGPQQMEDKIENPELEIKLKFNDKLVRKIEFLELTFEGFKGCLSYTTKYRMANNFAHFYENETVRLGTTRKKSSMRPVRGDSHLMYEEKGNEGQGSNSKQPYSKIANMSYRNYVSEGVGIKTLDKKRSPVGPLGVNRDKEDVYANRSFY